LTKEGTAEDRKRTFELFGAACGYLKKDKKTGKVDRNFPCVDCSFQCKSCGWNPKEQKRRLEEGRFEPALTRRNSETEQEIPLPVGTKRLVFPKYKAEGKHV